MFRINAHCKYTRQLLGMTSAIIKPALLSPKLVINVKDCS
jgi:hypothetical protein